MSKLCFTNKMKTLNDKSRPSFLSVARQTPHLLHTTTVDVLLSLCLIEGPNRARSLGSLLMSTPEAYDGALLADSPVSEGRPELAHTVLEGNRRDSSPKAIPQSPKNELPPTVLPSNGRHCHCWHSLSSPAPQKLWYLNITFCRKKKKRSPT